MNKKVITIIIGIVLIIAAFYGGMKYDQHAMAATRASRAGQFAAGTFRGGITARGGGGFTMGSILSQDANSITVKLADGSGSVIAFFNASTTIQKTAMATKSALTTGENVTVIGAKNSDGSINATSVQVRG